MRIRFCKRCGERQALTRSSFCPSCHLELDGAPEERKQEQPAGLELLALVHSQGEEAPHEH